MTQHKKVEFIELFYDLAFVYTISQITSLIHHLHNGVVSIESIFTFIISLILSINTWMIQTVFVNRFGVTSFRNIMLIFIQMFFIIMGAVNVSADTHTHSITNMWPIITISSVLLIQYIVQYYVTTDPIEKAWIRPYFTILGSRTILLIIALFFPYPVSMVILSISIILTWILPGIINKRIPHDTKQLFHVPHLIERLSLLAIIMFGERIIGIVPYFKGGFTWTGLLSFFTIAHLFTSYIIEFDHLIDTTTNNHSMLSVIYWHYSIYFGLSLVTVGLGFIGEVGNWFAISVLYIGFALTLIGIMAHSKYNKINKNFSTHYVTMTLSTVIIGYITSLFFTGNAIMLMLIACSVSTIVMCYFLNIYFSKIKKGV